MTRLTKPGPALAIILLMALAVRLLTFDRFLPLVDYPDEANMFLLAVDWRGNFPLADAYGAGLTGARLAGYPPLFPWIAVGMQYIVEAVSPEPFLFSGDYVFGLRLLAVVAGVLTTAALWAAGWALAGHIAAAFSALVWALAPVVVEWNSLAVPDPLVYLASAWTLAFALWAWHKDNPAWTLPALLCAIAAIYLKYTPLHVLAAWGLVVVVLLLRDWRRMLPWLALELVIGAACAAYLLFGYGALRLENDEALRVDPGMALNLERGLRNLHGTILPVGVGLSAAGFFGGIVAYLYSRRRGWLLTDVRRALYLLAVTVIGVLSISTFIGIEPYSNQMRHVLPVSVALICLWSMSVAQIVWTLRAMQAPALANALLAGVGLIFLGLALPGDMALIQRFAAPDLRYQLWVWSDASLPSDGKILMFPDSRLRAVWNRPYSGYDGQTAFEWAFDERPSRSTPQALAQQGMAYMAMTRDDWQTAYDSPDMAAFLNRLTLLKTLSAPQERGSDIFVYRLLPPQVQSGVTFGEMITLVGYDVNASGGTLHFRPYWRAEQQPAVNYSMFVHVLKPGDMQPIAQYDGSPASERRLASTWDDPAELLIGASVSFDLPPGEYLLLLGLYDYETGQRLLLSDGADRYELSVTAGE